MVLNVYPPKMLLLFAECIGKVMVPDGDEMKMTTDLQKAHWCEYCTLMVSWGIHDDFYHTSPLTDRHTCNAPSYKWTHRHIHTS